MRGLKTSLDAHLAVTEGACIEKILKIEWRCHAAPWDSARLIVSQDPSHHDAHLDCISHSGMY